MVRLTLLARRLALILLASLWGCGRLAERRTHQERATTTETSLSPLSAGSTSLYDLQLTLVDQDGRPFGLDGYRGHPVLISMFYASCPYACPTLISQIQKFERSLAPRPHEELRVLLVSFDPERDSAEKLKQLSLERHVDESRWRLARAAPEDVRQLAAVLGVKYRRLSDGGYNHSSVISVLDRRGFVRARSDGLAQQIDQQVADAASLLARSGS